jgi:exodeoxyribonuclease V alpha subunit
VLIETTEKMLEIETGIVSSTLDRMIKEQSLVLEGEEAVYLPPFYFSEVGTAKRVRELLSSPTMFKAGNTGAIIDRLQVEYNLRYDEVQVEAIKKAAASKFMVRKSTCAPRQS